MFKPKQKTLKQALLTAVVKSVLVVSMFGAPLMVSQSVASSPLAPTPSSVLPEKPAAEGSPVALVEKNDCWTGEAPADMVGVIPGHVVVTENGTAVLGGNRLVGLALEQIFEGKDHNLTVHGFCR